MKLFNIFNFNYNLSFFELFSNPKSIHIPTRDEIMKRDVSEKSTEGMGNRETTFLRYEKRFVRMEAFIKAKFL